MCRAKWKNEMERKKTLEWCKEKVAPEHERWCGGSLDGNLFPARVQCMDRNARNCNARGQSHGEDERTEHVALECEKYDRELR